MSDPSQFTPPSPSTPREETDWEQFPTFREFFLTKIPEIKDRQMLRRFGRWLYLLALEALPVAAHEEPSITVVELTASLRDLRIQQGILAHIGESEVARRRSDVPGSGPGPARRRSEPSTEAFGRPDPTRPRHSL